MPSLRDPSFWKTRVRSHQDGWRLCDLIQSECYVEPREARDLVDFGSVHVAGRVVRDGDRPLRAGEEVRIYWPWSGVRRFYELDPARLLYRDPWILAYDKEAGIPTQSMPSDGYNNVFEAAKRFLTREGIADPYVGLHHRLDRDTSGVLVMTVSRHANKALGRAFQDHRVKKLYLAWVRGIPEWDQKVVRRDIGREAGRYAAWAHRSGKRAETELRTIFRGSGRSLVQAVPKTGRTHQIRLHLAGEGFPILGDRLYGGPEAAHEAPRLLLHAFRLELPHPVTGVTLSLCAPLPRDWPSGPEPAIPG